MTILERVKADMKTAMKAKEQRRVLTLRRIVSDANNIAMEKKRKDATEDDSEEVVAEPYVPFVPTDDEMFQLKNSPEQQKEVVIPTEHEVCTSSPRCDCRRAPSV